MERAETRSSTDHPKSFDLDTSDAAYEARRTRFIHDLIYDIADPELRAEAEQLAEQAWERDMNSHRLAFSRGSVDLSETVDA